MQDEHRLTSTERPLEGDAEPAVPGHEPQPFGPEGAPAGSAPVAQDTPWAPPPETAWAPGEAPEGEPQAAAARGREQPAAAEEGGPAALEAEVEAGEQVPPAAVGEPGPAAAAEGVPPASELAVVAPPEPATAAAEAGGAPAGEPEGAEPVALAEEAEEPAPAVAEALGVVPPEAPGELEAVEEEAEPLPARAAAPEAEELEEEELEEAEERDLAFLPGDWFVVHTYAGYENKVRANLYSRIQSMNMEDKIYEVVIPTEEVMEIKSGKKQLVQKKVFPGYILVRMELDDDSWYVVRNTPGVTGFVGAGAKPTPLSVSEVQKILVSKPAERLRPRLEFQEGEVVRVISGPFANMSGPIAEINVDQQTVKVLVDIFGRETPVTLAFDQVAKL